MSFLGIGFGLIYVPAVITTGFYFEKWRALATGIAVCGSGIGTFLLAPFTAYCIERFGWRGAILIQAGKDSLMFSYVPSIYLLYTLNKVKKHPLFERI